MRRAQVALEFLSTYGWALLIILVMIGTINYFGVANPSSLTPSRCTSSTEIRCFDYISEDSAAKMMFRQSVGKTIYIQEVSCRYEGNYIVGTGTINGASLTPNSVWSPRHALEMRCDLSEFGVDALKGEKIKLQYTITYSLSQGGFPHMAEGELHTEIQ